MTLQFMASGAPSLCSMAWSHGLDGGNQWDSSLLNTFECLWYLSGTFTSCWYWWASCASLVEMEKHSSSSSSTICAFSWVDVGSTMVREIVVLVSLVSQFSDLTITSRCSVSMVLLAQLKPGSNMANQGYPRIRSSCPRSVIRNHILACFFPVCMLRSTYSVICPALLLIPSMFQIFLDHSSFRVPSASLLTNRGFMKLSVAPESTKICLSALAYAVRNETGIFMLRYLARYMVLHLSIRMTLPQAVGSEYFKNPSWIHLGKLCPSLPGSCCALGVLALWPWLV